MTVVVGAHDRGELDLWEPSGLVGLGCVRAVVAVQGQLRAFGFDAPVESAEELVSRELRRDLVLIGGPDANSVTAAMIQRIRPTLSFGFPAWRKHVVTLVDTTTGVAYRPKYDKRGRVTVDYGLLVRAPNPLADDGTEVIILAGCWGHGTAAAAESLGGKSLHRHKVSTRQPFEALVKVEVLDRHNHAVSVLAVRALDASRDSRP
ncbi:hypothetical protein AB0B18_28690 [Micromonospora chalcea]